MALDDYRKKRDFTKSPEPQGSQSGGRRVAGQPRFFCVQKHLASHLHYDFRLEHNGVLLSWAVPKGPALDPATKRLAMHVEDHPLEYGEFEGVIPEGYGAGIVMLWDRGTWTPETDDVDAALRKGDLKFTLDGYKLKGSWVLVRTSGRYAGSREQPGPRGGPSRTWLLIKHRDEWSGDLDILAFAPRSVKSDGDFEDILAQDNPDVWQSDRPAKAGETGALLASIIKKAAAIKADRTGSPRASRTKRPETTPAKTASAAHASPAASGGKSRSRTKTPGKKARSSAKRPTRRS